MAVETDGEVGICNLALNAIGHTKFITALNENSDEADVCELNYAQCRDEVLEAIDWPFATRRAEPAAITASTLELGEVPDEWDYAYLLPADCLPNGLRRIVFTGTRVVLPENQIKFVVEYDGALETSIVLTDEQDPQIVYTARIEDVARFSPLFKRALAERLAVECVRGLRKDAKLIPTHWSMYQAALGRAIAAAKKSQKPDNDPLPAHIAGRF
jgi:hypothetical protein